MIASDGNFNVFHSLFPFYQNRTRVFAIVEMVTMAKTVSSLDVNVTLVSTMGNVSPRKELNSNVIAHLVLRGKYVTSLVQKVTIILKGKFIKTMGGSRH